MSTTQQYSQVETSVPMLPEWCCSDRTTSESGNSQNEEIFKNKTVLNNRVPSGQGSSMTAINSLKLIGLLIMIVMIVTWVIVISVLVVQLHVVQRDEKQSNQLCLKCETLSSIIDKSAWKVVSEDNETETCCFNRDSGIDAMLTHYFSNRTNTTSVRPFTQQDMSTLMQMNNNIFNRKRSVLFLTSLNTVIIEGSDPKISWASSLEQGNISLCNDTGYISIMSTGIYIIYTQVKYRANIKDNFNSRTMKTKAQFFLGKLREGQLYHVDKYSEERMFHDRNIEHDADLHTVARFETGDKLIIRFPSSQKPFLASEQGAHRISIVELS